MCNFPNYSQLSNLNLVCGGFVLAPGDLVTVQSTNSLNPNDAELGLYTTNSFGSSAAIVDYVEWGTTGHTRSSVVMAAGIWAAGDFVPSWPAGMSIEYDGIGDSSADWSINTSTPCVNSWFSGCDFQLVSYDGFETSFGNWNDGGGDAFRIASNAAAGSFSIRLRDNSGEKSSMTTNPLDFTAVTVARVEFTYFAESMEDGEDFLLEYSTDGGNTFQVVRSWVAGLDFNNGEQNTVRVNFSEDFTANTVLRLRADASSNYDIIYIDEVSVSTCSESALKSDKNTVLTRSHSASKSSSAVLEIDKVETKVIESVIVFPNPAVHTLNIKGLNGRVYDVYSLSGQRVIKTSSDHTLDLSSLQNGTYLLRTIDGQIIKFNKI